MLIGGLPLEGSAFARAIGVDRGWGNVEELLAGLCELADAGNRLFFMAHSKKGTQAPKPLKIIRPPKPGEEKSKKRRQATSEELKAFFGGGSAIRYTGPGAAVADDAEELVGAAPPPAGPRRCPRGHYARAGVSCRACGAVGTGDADG